MLEVELPQDEMSRRRIGFYERCGFELCHLPYLQPPYRPGDTPLPMHLMFHGTASPAPIFNTIRDTIHRHVYGVIPLPDLFFPCSSWSSLASCAFLASYNCHELTKLCQML